MASTPSIQVNNESVESYLKSSKDNPFLIPEYQRKYAWGLDEVTRLFEDLKDFTDIELSRAESGEDKGTYFLGSIVVFMNDNKEREVIDGQQRLTSLLLLLRAIYTKLDEAKTKTPEAKTFMKKIEPCIWTVDEFNDTKIHFTETHIKSKSIDNEYNDRLQTILEYGKPEDGWTDSYSKNYRTFQKLYNDLVTSNPSIEYYFLRSLLARAIVLPITADNQDTALTIFSTLNDRGLPLTDADIFKAKIYEAKKEGDERDNFIKNWNKIESEAIESGETIQHLFVLYMFYQRALDFDTKSTTPGIRKYFEQNKYDRLRKPNVLDDIQNILNLHNMTKHSKTEDPWSNSKETLKIFDIFRCYPNEWWKYPVVIYYLKHRNQENFGNAFLLFLRKLCAELFSVYINNPYINAVKSDVMKLNAACGKSMYPEFDFKKSNFESDEFKKSIIIVNNVKIKRMILSILAYAELKQEELLPVAWEIEHIFPKKYNNYSNCGYSREKLDGLIENIGNLMPLEKALNIGASNDYYSKKKAYYQKSQIAMALNMEKRSDWTPEDIVVRNDNIGSILQKIFIGWNKEYNEAAKKASVV